MIKPEQIPDSVLKALAESMGCQWCMQDADDRGILSEHVAAAINAWPQSWSIEENDSAVIRGVSGKFLPLKEVV